MPKGYENFWNELKVEASDGKQSVEDCELIARWPERRYSKLQSF